MPVPNGPRGVEVGICGLNTRKVLFSPRSQEDSELLLLCPSGELTSVTCNDEFLGTEKLMKLF